MIEIYCGEGKGKTTAAVGLAVRAAGHGIPVLFMQFLKDGSSGEIEILRGIPGITVRIPDHFYGFSFRMSAEEKQIAKNEYHQMLEEAINLVRQRSKRQFNVLILDEIFPAIHAGLAEESQILEILDQVPLCAGAVAPEIVLTGRHPTDSILERADYISEIHKVRHPYDRGIPARIGIEK